MVKSRSELYGEVQSHTELYIIVRIRTEISRNSTLSYSVVRSGKESYRLCTVVVQSHIEFYIMV